MNELRIYGASDDLIEFEGCINDEVSFYSQEDEERFLAVSDGTLLKIRYDNDGIWRITKLFSGSSKFSKIEGDVEKDTNDVVILFGDNIKWVLFGDRYVK